MIKVESVSKIYRAGDVETSALQGISLEIAPGEFVAITGPSGCGKSTLLNILGLIDTPTSGRYWLLDQEVSGRSEGELTPLRQKGIGFIFQNFHLITHLSVAENVAMPLVYQRVGRKEREERVQSALERMGIPHRAQHFPRQLSGGQQQRVAIARAIVAGPAVILADEPTGNLDSVTGSEVIGILEGLAAAGTPVVMVTHFKEHANRADRIVHLVDGRIVSDSLTQSGKPSRARLTAVSASSYVSG